MANTTKQMELQLEMAEAPVSFLNGQYFRGMCEIAAAAHTKSALYVPANTQGIFDSLFHKRIFARKQLENGSWIVGNFDVMTNRYLYVYDRTSGTYRDKKEDNYNKFVELVKEISEKKNYEVFSIEAPKAEIEDLDAILG